MNKPDFSFEKRLWKRGFITVAGCDEVGRGCFAGPVVAGCVAFQGEALEPQTVMINDSKKMTVKQRELASFWIRKNALSYGIGKASVTQINKLGIKKSTEIAFRKAISNSGKKIDYLLVDAFYLPYVKGLRRKKQTPIIKGDSKSFSIAAASIIAKVYRDNLMNKIAHKRVYEKYCWERNKGYGTLEHRKAILKYGISRMHRKQFVESFISNYLHPTTYP